MLAVSNSHRRRHIGSALVQETEARLAAMGCQKLNLQVRTSNAAVVR
jgi:ribosomal protein S18 acetylase RimI-like enzyme